jgi:hypothetical protein
MNIYTEEYLFKFGSLIQFGTSYMEGFSPFSDSFVSKFEEVKQELNLYGHSVNWVDWQKQNSQNIIDLYDSLNSQGMIPTQSNNP